MQSPLRSVSACQVYVSACLIGVCVFYYYYVEVDRELVFSATGVRPSAFSAVICD